MAFRLNCFVFIVGLAGSAASAAPQAGLAFVQATVVAPDAVAGTLSFVDASGRSRSHAVAGSAAARVGRLRPGDEVIVVLSGPEPVVQDVRVSQAAAPAAADPGPGAATDAPDETQWTLVPAASLRPTWPNPYSRYYKGPKPAPAPRARR